MSGLACLVDIGLGTVSYSHIDFAWLSGSVCSNRASVFAAIPPKPRRESHIPPQPEQVSIPSSSLEPLKGSRSRMVYSEFLGSS